MIKAHSRFLIDPQAKLGKKAREIPVQYPKNTLWDYIGYGIVAAGITFAASFLLTPADAREIGSMNHEARVIEVSPSISIYGSSREVGRTRLQIMRDNNRHVNDMELEDLRSRNRRALEADRAYYKKLEFQRKKRGW